MFVAGVWAVWVVALLNFLFIMFGNIKGTTTKKQQWISICISVASLVVALGLLLTTNG